MHDLTPLPGAVGTGSTALSNTNLVNLPAANISGSVMTAISLFNSNLTRFLNLEISALEADQRGKVVSSPRVLTADQGKAIIEQGTSCRTSRRRQRRDLDPVPQGQPEMR